MGLEIAVSPVHCRDLNLLTMREPVLLLSGQALDSEGASGCLFLELLAERGHNIVDSVSSLSVDNSSYTLGTIR